MRNDRINYFIKLLNSHWHLIFANGLIYLFHVFIIYFKGLDYAANLTIFFSFFSIITSVMVYKFDVGIVSFGASFFYENFLKFIFVLVTIFTVLNLFFLVYDSSLLLVNLTSFFGSLIDVLGVFALVNGFKYRFIIAKIVPYFLIIIISYLVEYDMYAVVAISYFFGCIVALLLIFNCNSFLLMQRINRNVLFSYIKYNFTSVITGAIRIFGFFYIFIVVREICSEDFFSFFNLMYRIIYPPFFFVYTVFQLKFLVDSGESNIMNRYFLKSKNQYLLYFRYYVLYFLLASFGVLFVNYDINFEFLSVFLILFLFTWFKISMQFYEEVFHRYNLTHFVFYMLSIEIIILFFAKLLPVNFWQFLAIMINFYLISILFLYFLNIKFASKKF
jgi:hypothetical protein